MQIIVLYGAAIKLFKQGILEMSADVLCISMVVVYIIEHNVTLNS